MVRRRFLFFLIFLSVISAATHAFSKDGEAVSRKVLGNGLTVLVKECPSQGLVSIDVAVKAGSSLEGDVLASGISHFVEHMVFKGTSSRRAGDIEREIKSYGGFINGSVSKDLTDFRVTVPAAYFAKALALLKDMLSNASFDAAEFEKEKEVILKEIYLDKDDPQSQLSRLLYESAYIRHPYRYPVIGYDDSFKSLKREDLVRYYEKMYVPNRITIGIAGSVNASDAVAAVEGEFAAFRMPDYRETVLVSEPAQIARRYSEKESSVSLSYLAMAFHSTAVLDKDLFAMDVLAMILGLGDDSRLNRTLLKERSLVYSVTAWNYTPREPGLFVITASLERKNLDTVESEILNEIDRIKKGPIDPGDLKAAKRKVVSDYIFSRETVEAEAADITMNEALTGDPHFSKRYVDGIEAVSEDDLRRVAAFYLTEDNLTSVRLNPSYSKPVPEETRRDPSVGKDTIRKETLANGLRILLRKNAKTPTVSVSAVFFGGLLAENKDDNGISNLTARMLLKGTAARKENEIKGAIERLGGSIDSFSGFNGFGLEIALLKDDLDTGLDILGDILTNSAFPENEMDKEKVLILAAIKEEDADIFENGYNMLKKELFGSHPYGLRYIGEERSIASLTREDALKFYMAYCVPNNMVLSISGDIDAELLMPRLKNLFGSMTPREIPKISREGAGPGLMKAKALEMDKEESLLLIAFKTVNIRDPDRYALDLAGSVLSGYSGRLFDELRDKRSLAYALGCVQKLGVDAGYFSLYLATAKERIPEARSALIGQVEALGERTVTDSELSLAKRELTGGKKIRKQTNAFFSLESALDEIYGLGYDNIYKYEDEIDKVTKDDIKRVASKYLDPALRAEIVITSR